MRKRAANTKNVTLGILLGIVLVAGLVFGALVILTPKNEEVAPDDDSSLVEDGYVSKDEQDYVADEGDETPVTDPSSDKVRLDVTVDVDYSDGVIEAFGTIYGTVNTGGKCVYNFVGPDGTNKTVEAKVLSSASTVNCGRAEYRTSISGSWDVLLRYETDSELGEGYASVVVE